MIFQNTTIEILRFWKIFFFVSIIPNKTPKNILYCLSIVELHKEQ